MNARYPNLELLEYKARAALSRDEEFLKIFEEKKKNSMRRGYGPECWSQISGISTADSGGPVNEAELPGQMTIFDFPDAIPDGGQNE